jgi:hypothetical protein
VSGSLTVVIVVVGIVVSSRCQRAAFAVTAVLTLVLRRASATMLSKMLRDEQQSEA